MWWQMNELEQNKDEERVVQKESEHVVLPPVSNLVPLEYIPRAFAQNKDFPPDPRTTENACKRSYAFG